MEIILFWLYNTPVNFVNFYVLTPESPIFRGLYSWHFRVSFCQFCQFSGGIDLYSRFWLASAQRSSETIVLFKNAESSRSFALDDFSFLWYDPFAGLMVFAIILYHKKKSLALPFRSVPGSFSLLGLQQPLFLCESENMMKLLHSYWHFHAKGVKLHQRRESTLLEKNALFSCR